MRKTAILIDFDSKHLKEKLGSNNYDLFVLDRLKDNVVNVETSDENEFRNAFIEELSFSDFYKTISKSYKEVLCLFLSHDSLDISDYIMTNEINIHRTVKDARIYTYLIQYDYQGKDVVLDNVLEMVNKGISLREIIIRIHNIRKKETVTFNDFLLSLFSLNNVKE